jgi:crotonobetainyl-CoA:carnitine CoA-transferase CaiB-like acyl-CoA transferase
LLNEKRIPCAPVNKFSQALNDDQVRHRNMVVDLKHPGGKHTQGPGNPIKFSRTDEESFFEPPLLGQHTNTVLKDILSYSDEDVENLRSKGVVK